MRYVALYNTQLPQSVLGIRTPMQAMKDWHKSYPHDFVNHRVTFRDATATRRRNALDSKQADPGHLRLRPI